MRSRRTTPKMGSGDYCCRPRRCCFGQRSVIAGALTLARVDAVINLILLACLLSFRQLLVQSPSIWQTVLWHALVAAADTMLAVALGSGGPGGGPGGSCRLAFVMLWQVIFVFNLVVLITIVVLLFTLVAPDLQHVAATIAKTPDERTAVEISLVAALVISCTLLPYYVYMLRVVNGAKAALFRWLVECDTADAVSAVVVQRRVAPILRRHSEPTLQTLSRSIVLQQAEDSAAGKEKRRRMGDRQWIHQEVIPPMSPVPFCPESAFIMKEPISQLRPLDPMRPFLPLYPAKAPSTASAASARRRPPGEFILPPHYGTVDRRQSEPSDPNSPSWDSCVVQNCS